MAPISQGPAVPFGGTTVPLFDKDNTLHKGRQKCRLHRHKAADGLSTTATPSVLPPPRSRGKKVAPLAVNTEADEMERLEKLFKKHEMGDIPRIDWLDQLVFRGAEKRGLEASKASQKSSGRKQEDAGSSAVATNGVAPEDGDHVSDDGGDFSLYVDFPRFDFPIVFSDHEYPPPPISSHPHLTQSSSAVNLKPPPEVQFGPGIGDVGGGENGYGGRLVRIYDPEVGARDNPAESKHRRLVRSHRTGVLDRDLKPNAKIRDELNVGASSWRNRPTGCTDKPRSSCHTRQQQSSTRRRRISCGNLGIISRATRG